MHCTAWTSSKICMRRSRGKFWDAKLFARKNVRTKCENTQERHENIFFLVALNLVRTHGL